MPKTWGCRLGCDGSFFSFLVSFPPIGEEADTISFSLFGYTIQALYAYVLIKLWPHTRA